MILSMTGYGKAVVSYKGKKITIEVKSLNSKSLDLNTRIASGYREMELDIRRKIQTRLLRGKVDLSITSEEDILEQATPVNADLLKLYYDRITAIGKDKGITLPID
ncbi:MAG: hypothetical protein LUC22_04645, partial [Prevotella sp.]|nr:hypothetical protein [Prevotella sp.]